MHSRRSSVFHWHCEPNQVEGTLFMNLQLPEWLQVKPYGHHEAQGPSRILPLSDTFHIIEINEVGAGEWAISFGD